MEYIGACTLYTEAFFRIRMGFFVLDMRAPNAKWHIECVFLTQHYQLHVTI